MAEGEIDELGELGGVERLLQHGHDRVAVTQPGHATRREGRHEDNGDVGNSTPMRVASSVPFICGITTSQRMRSTAPFRRRTRWRASAPSLASTRYARSWRAGAGRDAHVLLIVDHEDDADWRAIEHGPSAEEWPARSYPPAGSPARPGSGGCQSPSPRRSSNVCSSAASSVSVAHLHGTGARSAAGHVELVVVVADAGHAGERRGVQCGLLAKVLRSRRRPNPRPRR